MPGSVEVVVSAPSNWGTSGVSVTAVVEVPASGAGSPPSPASAAMSAISSTKDTPARTPVIGSGRDRTNSTSLFNMPRRLAAEDSKAEARPPPEAARCPSAAQGGPSGSEVGTPLLDARVLQRPLRQARLGYIPPATRRSPLDKVVGHVDLGVNQCFSDTLTAGREMCRINLPCVPMPRAAHTKLKPAVRVDRSPDSPGTA